MKKIDLLLADRINRIPPQKMKPYFDLAEGCLSLALGEPGFISPTVVSEGAVQAIREGKTFYPPAEGYEDLRKAISQYLKKRFDYSYTKDEVLITMGASLGLDAILRTFINDGDEILIPTPAYGYYTTLAGLSGGIVKYLPTDESQEWSIDKKVLQESITDKTKLLILNYPNNPTGRLMSHKQFANVADVLKDTDILVVSDEIYAEILYQKEYESILYQENMRERTFLVSGFSKSLAMTGWRIGYVCAPQEMLSYVSKLNAATTLCASSVSQEGAYAGLIKGSASVVEMRNEYRKRRNFALERINALGWSVTSCDGTFYIWANINSTGMEAEVFASKLLKKAGVALIPGTAFGNGYEDYVRIAYTAPMDVLQKAFERIENFLNTCDKS